MKEEIEFNKKSLLKFVGIILVILFLTGLYLSYSNGFSKGLKSICKDKQVFFNEVTKTYECNNLTERVMFVEI